MLICKLADKLFDNSTYICIKKLKYEKAKPNF